MLLPPFYRRGDKQLAPGQMAGTGGAGVHSAACVVSTIPPCLSAYMIPKAQALSASADSFREYLWSSCSAPGSVLGTGEGAVDQTWLQSRGSQEQGQGIPLDE